eukprot:CAMPEP_0196590280 /NCGR_PEP_ID=MMETSP1081-20130531/66179_1 /TAXON_ID=36882 /ORGANISM="Pyramimonas amylifera, Strain CCMP720" /LENGTH=294 /DNA_ID=CAMNT_0041913343 /DNA_START=17 /DNA_END=901 /DNA_ORIENTATION=-
MSSSNPSEKAALMKARATAAAAASFMSKTNPKQEISNRKSSVGEENSKPSLLQTKGTLAAAAAFMTVKKTTATDKVRETSESNKSNADKIEEYKLQLDKELKKRMRRNSLGIGKGATVKISEVMKMRSTFDQHMQSFNKEPERSSQQAKPVKLQPGGVNLNLHVRPGMKFKDYLKIMFPSISEENAVKLDEATLPKKKELVIPEEVEEVELSEADQAFFDKAFEELDEDGSGRLERREVEGLFHKLGITDPEDAQETFDEMDIDSSESITKENFISWWLANITSEDFRTFDFKN